MNLRTPLESIFVVGLPLALTAAGCSSVVRGGPSCTSAVARCPDDAGPNGPDGGGPDVDPRDTGNTIDTGNTDAGGDIDAGGGLDTGSGGDSVGPPPACYAGAAFTPIPWAPPTMLHQGVCTDAEVTAFEASVSTAGPYTSGNSTCDACIATDASATTHGPVITMGGTPTNPNYGGCAANFDGMTAAGGCGNTFNDAHDCTTFECGGVAPGGTMCADFDSPSMNGPTAMCEGAAFGVGGQCTGFAATAACRAELDPGGIAASCGPLLSNLITLWCGP